MSEAGNKTLITTAIKQVAQASQATPSVIMPVEAASDASLLNTVDNAVYALPKNVYTTVGTGEPTSGYVFSPVSGSLDPLDFGSIIGGQHTEYGTPEAVRNFKVEKQSQTSTYKILTWNPPITDTARRWLLFFRAIGGIVQGNDFVEHYVIRRGVILHADRPWEVTDTTVIATVAHTSTDAIAGIKLSLEAANPLFRTDPVTHIADYSKLPTLLTATDASANIHQFPQVAAADDLTFTYLDTQVTDSRSYIYYIQAVTYFMKEGITNSTCLEIASDNKRHLFSLFPASLSLYLGQTAFVYPLSDQTSIQPYLKLPTVKTGSWLQQDGSNPTWGGTAFPGVYKASTHPYVEMISGNLIGTDNTVKLCPVTVSGTASSPSLAMRLDFPLGDRSTQTQVWNNPAEDVLTINAAQASSVSLVAALEGFDAIEVSYPPAIQWTIEKLGSTGLYTAVTDTTIAHLAWSISGGAAGGLGLPSSYASADEYHRCRYNYNKLSVNRAKAETGDTYKITATHDLSYKKYVIVSVTSDSTLLQYLSFSPNWSYSGLSASTSISNPLVTFQQVSVFVPTPKTVDSVTFTLTPIATGLTHAGDGGGAASGAVAAMYPIYVPPTGTSAITNCLFIKCTNVETPATISAITLDGSSVNLGTLRVVDMGDQNQGSYPYPLDPIKGEGTDAYSYIRVDVSVPATQTVGQRVFTVRTYSGTVIAGIVEVKASNLTGSTYGSFDGTANSKVTLPIHGNNDIKFNITGEGLNNLKGISEYVITTGSQAPVVVNSGSSNFESSVAALASTYPPITVDDALRFEKSGITTYPVIPLVGQVIKVPVTVPITVNKSWSGAGQAYTDIDGNVVGGFGWSGASIVWTITSDNASFSATDRTIKTVTDNYGFCSPGDFLSLSNHGVNGLFVHLPGTVTFNCAIKVVGKTGLTDWNDPSTFFNYIFPLDGSFLDAHNYFHSIDPTSNYYYAFTVLAKAATTTDEFYITQCFTNQTPIVFLPGTTPRTFHKNLTLTGAVANDPPPMTATIPITPAPSAYDTWTVLSKEALFTAADITSGGLLTVTSASGPSNLRSGLISVQVLHHYSKWRTVGHSENSPPEGWHTLTQSFVGTIEYNIQEDAGGTTDGGELIGALDFAWYNLGMMHIAPKKYQHQVKAVYQTAGATPPATVNQLFWLVVQDAVRVNPNILLPQTPPTNAASERLW